MKNAKTTAGTSAKPGSLPKLINSSRNTVTNTTTSQAVPSSSGPTRLALSPRNVEHVANCVMVDTIGLLQDYASPTELPNKFARIDDSNCAIEGDEWGTGALQSEAGKQSIRVRTTRGKPEMWAKNSPRPQLAAEGSPAAHRQGHNIVSSGNVTALTYDMLRAVHNQYGLVVPNARKLQIARGSDVEITRVDLALLLRVPDGLSKGALINGLALAGIAAGCNISLYQNQTVYFDQYSQSHSTKIYDKKDETESKRKPALPESENVGLLVELMDEYVRLESVFRKKYFLSHADFKGAPVHPMLLDKTMLASMLLSELQRHNLRGQLQRRLKTEELYAVPLPYRNILAHWQNGMNVRKFFNSESTLKQHRAYLKNNYSVDIFAPPPGEIELPIEIGEILTPDNFTPVPDAIKNDPTLFFEEDMDAVCRYLLDRFPSGISSAFVNPYAKDEVIELEDGSRLVI